MTVKDQVKQCAYNLGVDLVGVGNVERCAHAPVMMSPQGLFPECRSIIVVGLHHPDACIELGGEVHPQEIGPYDVQYLMNDRLDEIAYRLATFLEKLGFRSMPIAASNIWRYNRYKGLDAIFAPDVSNIYMAVVAGLADMGFNGLALTPEFGARNRFVTVMTDAVLEPDPLIPPGTVCDSCMLCRKHCPTRAFDEEVDGENVLTIEDYEYRFPRKNLWRCSWGEHFDLDLDLEIPAEVNERVILETVAKHGTRSGEMGQCLKFCLPPDMRTWDRAYSRTPVRKLPASPGSAGGMKPTFDRLLTGTRSKGVEEVIVNSVAELRELGVDIPDNLPGAERVVTAWIVEPDAAEGSDMRAIARSREPFRWGAMHLVNSACYDLARELERVGYRSVMSMKGWRMAHDVAARTGRFPDRGTLHANCIVTQAPLPIRARAAQSADAAPVRACDLTEQVVTLARDLGADLVGVAPAGRLADIAEQVRDRFEGQRIFEAGERGRFAPWEPHVTEHARHVFVPGDYLAGARSVLVFALRYHAETVRQAGKPPAEAPGPYAFQTYATAWVGNTIAVRLVKELESTGHRAVICTDLLGTASVTANPRGVQPDSFSNRFAAVAAGLGWLSVSGRAVTPEFGMRQRFVAVVTDAELSPSRMISPSDAMDLCRSCDRRCVSACPSRAFTSPGSFNVEGIDYCFGVVDAPLCDWTKRYALMKDSGFKYLGSETDINPGTEVTADKLASALPQLDPIKNIRPVILEPCLMACPYSGRE